MNWTGVSRKQPLNFTLQKRRKICPSHQRLLDDQNFHIPRCLGENFASSRKTMKRSTNWPKKKTDKKETKRTGLRIKKKKSRQVVFFSFKNALIEISISAHARTQILKYFYKWPEGLVFRAADDVIDCSASIWLDNGHKMAFVPLKKRFFCGNLGVKGLSVW